MNDSSPIMTRFDIMFVQNDEMLTRDETFRNIVHPDNIVHQSGSSDMISVYSIIVNILQI